MGLEWKCPRPRTRWTQRPRVADRSFHRNRQRLEMVVAQMDRCGLDVRILDRTGIPTRLVAMTSSAVRELGTDHVYERRAAAGRGFARASGTTDFSARGDTSEIGLDAPFPRCCFACAVGQGAARCDRL
jgi:hypothetical protein